MFLYSSQEKKGNGQKFSPLLKLHSKIMLKTLEIESCPGENLMHVSFRLILESGGGSEQEAGMCDDVKGSWTEKGIWRNQIWSHGSRMNAPERWEKKGENWHCDPFLLSHRSFLNTDGPDLPPGISAEHRAVWHVCPMALQRDLHLLML